MVKPNARIKIVADTERQMAGLLDQLGLTPPPRIARSRPAAQMERRSMIFLTVRDARARTNCLAALSAEDCPKWPRATRKNQKNLTKSNVRSVSR